MISRGWCYNPPSLSISCAPWRDSRQNHFLLVLEDIGTLQSFQLSEFSSVSEHNTASNPTRALSFRSFLADAIGNRCLVHRAMGEIAWPQFHGTDGHFCPDEGHH